MKFKRELLYASRIERVLFDRYEVKRRIYRHDLAELIKDGKVGGFIYPLSAEAIVVDDGSIDAHFGYIDKPSAQPSRRYSFNDILSGAAFIGLKKDTQNVLDRVAKYRDDILKETPKGVLDFDLLAGTSYRSLTPSQIKRGGFYKAVQKNTDNSGRFLSRTSDSVLHKALKERGMSYKEILVGKRIFYVFMKEFVEWLPDGAWEDIKREVCPLAQ